MLRARDIMTEKPHCALPQSTVFETAELMRDENCGAIPVLDNEGKCVGMMTDRDISLRVLLEDKDPHQTVLQDVMTHNPAYCHADDPIEDVITIMQTRHIHRMPVVDEQQVCVGIISASDIENKPWTKNRSEEQVTVGSV